MFKKLFFIGLCSLAIQAIQADEYPIIDIGTDLTTFKIAETNITPSATEDATARIQAVIDYLAEKGGGIVVIPPGTYLINGLMIRPEVEMVGSGRQKTIFRTSGPKDMILMEGGAVRNFTLYGTPSENVSGDNWVIGTGGVGKGGTARALNLIALREASKLVLVDNIEALEARYDCLYVRDCAGLKVTNSHFDRAGRNIFSLVGNSDKFLFSGCYFGSYWGLYHSDIEPNEGKWAQNGIFINCKFDGANAGDKGGSAWGKMFTFSGMNDRKTRNICVLDCLFQGINVRVRGVFPRVQFLYNDFQISGLNTAFLQVRTNKGATLDDCRIIGNRFTGVGGERLIYNVAITGEPVIKENVPEIIYQKAEVPKDSNWQEDHPTVLKSEKKIEIIREKDNAVLVKMPLMGFEFNFAEGQVFPAGTTKNNDLSMHIDPMLALGKAEISRPGDQNFSRQLWNIKPGETILVKTNAGKLAEMTIIGQDKQNISFRYIIK